MRYYPPPFFRIENLKPKIFVDSIGSLENVYHELIPISQHMGVKVRNYTGSELTLVDPLANNGWKYGDAIQRSLCCEPPESVIESATTFPTGKSPVVKQ